MKQVWRRAGGNAFDAMTQAATAITGIARRAVGPTALGLRAIDGGGANRRARPAAASAYCVPLLAAAAKREGGHQARAELPPVALRHAA